MKKNILLIVSLILLSLIPLTDWFHSGLPITHDGQDHVARIANFYQNLQQGILIPRWAANLNWGYGHPILMFLYPMPSYMASLFHLLGFSFVDSTKLVFVISFILSGLTMYIWCKEFLSKEAAFIGAMFYMFAPYRFIDLYVRGAIGEHVAFIFPPLILYFLLKTSKSTKEFWKWKFVPLGSFSLALLILSHNAISLMFLPIIILYIMYLFLHTGKKISFLRNSLLIMLLGFSLSAFFWMPALFEGKYTLRNIVTENNFEKNFSSWHSFIYGPWNYEGSGQFTVQIGIVQWIVILYLLIFSLIQILKKEYTLFIFTNTLIFIFFFTLFLMTNTSKIIWDTIPIMQNFQFPWRFLSLIIFSTALLGALAVSNIPQKYQTVTIVVLVLCLLLQHKEYWHAKGYQYKPETFYNGIYPGTTDTGESSPIWSVRFMEHTPKAHIEIISGKAKIIENVYKIANHQYTILAKEKAQLRENTLYFPGWKIEVDGKPVNIQYQDPNNRGLMTFWVNEGEHQIKINFKETKLRLVANSISVTSLIIIILILVPSPFRRRFVEASTLGVRGGVETSPPANEVRQGRTG